MPKIGDRVIVQITGAPNTGTALSGGIKVGPGATIKIGGKIVAEYTDEWEVELDVSFGGRKLIRVPKGVSNP